eukprot:gene17460-19207_t
MAANTLLAVEDFHKLYLSGNKPCVLHKDLTKDWRSRQEWVVNGKPNFSHLREHFGSSKVPVANCDKREHNAHCKKDMLFEDFIAYWESCSKSKSKLLYLKDWHFQREYPEYRAYEVLDYFKSDWLNEYCDGMGSDDYRFVYMGPRGLLFMLTFLGKVSILLTYRFWAEEKLKDNLGNLPFDITSGELKDAKKFPNAQHACQPLEIFQEEGEIVFVPSGWFHQVHNLEDTISINHNWTNAYGLDFMFQHLRAELLLVENEISEHRETMEGWKQHCQLILKSCAGMDYEEFYNMITALTKPRIKSLKQAMRWKETKKDSESLQDLLDAFKQLDVTCVPREQFIYSRVNRPSIQHNCNYKLIENRILNVTFDLRKLTEIFQSLCKEECLEKKLINDQLMVNVKQLMLNAT